MKIDIYTLLGMVKDGKAPKKIVYENEVLYYDDVYPETYNYYDEEWNNGLFDGNIGEILNDEVEILEATLNTKDMNIIAWRRVLVHRFLAFLGSSNNPSGIPCPFSMAFSIIR